MSLERAHATAQVGSHGPAASASAAEPIVKLLLPAPENSLPLEIGALSLYHW